MPATSTNPVFNAKTLEKMRSDPLVLSDPRIMTLQGSINRTGILLLLTIATSILSWKISDTEFGATLALTACLSNIGFFVLMIFKRHLAPIFAPAYALAEGLILGFISAWAERFKPGIAGNAILLTFACSALVLVLYSARIIRVTQRLKSVLLTATLAITATYLVDAFMGWIAGHHFAMIHEGGIYGIGFSVLVVGIAALNLLLDFDMIEKATAQKAPQYMEWYAGFAVLVTVVWLYLEILRLLGKLSKD